MSYKLNGKDASNTIYIPQYSPKHQPPIRGIMQNVGASLDEVFIFDTALDEEHIQGLINDNRLPDKGTL